MCWFKTRTTTANIASTCCPITRWYARSLIVCVWHLILKVHWPIRCQYLGKRFYAMFNWFSTVHWMTFTLHDRIYCPISVWSFNKVQLRGCVIWYPLNDTASRIYNTYLALYIHRLTLDLYRSHICKAPFGKEIGDTSISCWRAYLLVISDQAADWTQSIPALTNTSTL